MFGVHPTLKIVILNQLWCCLFLFSMSQLMQHHGCGSHLRDRSKLTGQEERFDMVVDSNDVILEKVVRIESGSSLCLLTYNVIFQAITGLSIMDPHFFCCLFSCFNVHVQAMKCFVQIYNLPGLSQNTIRGFCWTRLLGWPGHSLLCLRAISRPKLSCLVGIARWACQMWKHCYLSLWFEDVISTSTGERCDQYLMFLLYREVTAVQRPSASFTRRTFSGRS